MDGKGIPLISGEVHYWRLAPPRWREIVTRVREMGLEVVATYVCWEYHEYDRGQFDFTGKTEPQRNLIGFLQLLQEMGFWIVIRPGPYIYSGWKNAGVPDHVAAYHRLSAEYQSAATLWIKAVAERRNHNQRYPTFEGRARGEGAGTAARQGRGRGPGALLEGARRAFGEPSAGLGDGEDGGRTVRGRSGVRVQVGGGWEGLVGEELLERRGPGACDSRGLGAEAEPVENGSDDGGIREKRDELAARVAPGTVEDRQAENAFHKFCPGVTAALGSRG
ncbi:MAG: beta-galactosidase [Planctomycetota bacterium]